MIDYEKIKEREEARHREEYYSDKNKLIRHNKMLEQDAKAAKEKNDLQITWSSCNNDWS